MSCASLELTPVSVYAMESFGHGGVIHYLSVDATLLWKCFALLLSSTGSVPRSWITRDSGHDRTALGGNYDQIPILLRYTATHQKGDLPELTFI